MGFLTKTGLALLVFIRSILELFFSIFRLLISIVGVLLAWTSSAENLLEYEKVMLKSLFELLPKRNE